MVIYIPRTLRAQPTAWPKQYNSPSDPPKRDPSVCAITKYTPPLSTRQRSHIPTAASTLIRARLTVAITIKIPLKIPACATMKPERKNLNKQNHHHFRGFKLNSGGTYTITPKILINTDVNTPSHVPNKIGCDMKKLVRHQGLSP